jgi:flagellar basal body-associated protein FliL
LLWAVTLALLVVGLVWGLLYAPQDAKQGNSFRIIYLHVPVSFLALAGYYIMAIAGAVGLIWKMKLSYMVMKSAAPLGAALTFLALFTGAVWGKPTWGTYWVWDARITSMLILLFLYLGVLALQYAFHSQDTGNQMLRVLNSEAHQKREADTEARMAEVVSERTKLLNSEEGESLSIDDLQDIYCQVKAEERIKYNFSLNTKSKTGEITDYLESRRPFGATE